MILTQCTATKKDHACPARELYDSSYADAMRKYATAKDGEWRILSAKHGLLHPDTVIEPYDEYGLSEEQAVEIADELADQGVDHVEIVAGRSYCDPLTPELEARGIDVVESFQGKRIGYKEQAIRREYHRIVNESLC